MLFFFVISRFSTLSVRRDPLPITAARSIMAASFATTEHAMRLASRIALLIGLVVVGSSVALAQPKPKLVVMISIDQFPYEYLERMRSGFSKDGAFLRLCDEGANYTNCHHGQAFTKTGPG